MGQTTEGLKKISSVFKIFKIYPTLTQTYRFMKFWIGTIISFFVIAAKPPLAAQSVKDPKTVKKQEKADIDSLLLVYSLPINVSYTDNFTQPGIADSLIALLKRKKYKYLDSPAYAQLFKEKLNELLGLGDLEGMREFIANTQSDKTYYVNKVQSADPIAQQIQLSFLKNDSGINYINIRRSNPLNTKKFRDWVFTYSDSDPADQVAERILNFSINRKEMP